MLAIELGGGDLLQDVSDDLKDEKEIVLLAVKQDGWTLQFASDRLKNDDEVILATNVP